jgi:hypothetical protein
VVTLGDGASLRALTVEDAARPVGANAVGVHSRHPADSVSARIVECVVVSPNYPGATLDGPSRDGIVVLTRNRAGAEDPEPDDDASVNL